MNEGAVEPEEVFWIENMETFEVIGDTVRMEILEWLSRPRSVKELAELMEVPRTRLYHHIGLLVDAGVIRVVDSRDVGAMTERIYQVTAHSYQPSPGFLESADPRRQAQLILDALFASTRADFVRAVEDGLVSLQQSQDDRSTEVARRSLHLGDDDLRAMIEELSKVVDKYVGRQDEKADPVAFLSVIYRSARGRR